MSGKNEEPKPEGSGDGKKVNIEGEDLKFFGEFLMFNFVFHTHEKRIRV